VTCAQVLLRAGESSEVSMPLRILPDLAIWSVEVRPSSMEPCF
jgi:hypothetical protein